MRFENKVVLVTGGGSGIGRATALRFAQEGANVAVSDILRERANKVAEEISQIGGMSLAINADVSKENECETMVRTVVKHFDHLDIVFANAGISGGEQVLYMPSQDWDRVISVNLRGIFLTCKFSIQPLIDSNGGAIVTMASSMAGWDTSAGGAAYMASKEGVIGLTKSLALQLGGYGIRVNAICPGIIKTHLGHQPGMSLEEWEARYNRFAKRIPLRRVGMPDDVAAAVAFLASEDARHITGSALLIDGGQTLQSWSNAPDEEAYPLHQEP